MRREEFIDSAITSPRRYAGTRLRRYAKYQRLTIERSFANKNVDSVGDLTADDADWIAKFLQITLYCRAPSSGAAPLFRPGYSGLLRLKAELLPQQIIDTFIRIYIHSQPPKEHVSNQQQRVSS